jgi:hypothetical protein
MIRAHRLATLVARGDSCGLPCSVLLMAGVGRTLRGTLILEANPDDPPFIRPLVEDRFVAYGAPPEFLVAVHDAWAGRPRTIGPGDIAAIEVGSAEGLATIPPPPPAVPFTGPLLPFQPVGNVVTGLFQRADFAAADRSVWETGADAAWVVSPTPGLPSVRAIIIEPGTSRFVTATFVMAPERTGFGFDVFIDVNDIESPTSILGVFASNAEGAGVALFGLVPDHDDLRMQFPNVLLDHNASAILDAATITVMLYGPEQQTLFVTFTINDEARAAFAAAFAASRD